MQGDDGRGNQEDSRGRNEVVVICLLCAAVRGWRERHVYRGGDQMLLYGLRVCENQGARAGGQQ